jgi:hypothetical protein
MMIKCQYETGAVVNGNPKNRKTRQAEAGLLILTLKQSLL